MTVAKKTAGKKAAGKKARLPRPEKIRSIAFADDTLAMLLQLGQAAHDLNGRRMSHSRIIRALIRHAASQPPHWLADALLPVIEAEIASGVQWGRESPTKKSFAEK